MSVEALPASFFFRQSTWRPDQEGDTAIISRRRHLLRKSLLSDQRAKNENLVRERPKGMSSWHGNQYGMAPRYSVPGPCRFGCSLKQIRLRFWLFVPLSLPSPQRNGRGLTGPGTPRKGSTRIKSVAWRIPCSYGQLDDGCETLLAPFSTGWWFWPQSDKERCCYGGLIIVDFLCRPYCDPASDVCF